LDPAGQWAVTPSSSSTHHSSPNSLDQPHPNVPLTSKPIIRTYGWALKPGYGYRDGKVEAASAKIQADAAAQVLKDEKELFTIILWYKVYLYILLFVF